MSTTNTEVTKVLADYFTKITIKGVVVLYPDGKTDKFLKLINEHQIEISGQDAPITIPTHYRRGDKVGGKENGKFVTKNFFLDPSLQGKKVVTNIEVVEKIDHYRNNEKTVILNVTPASEGAKAEFILKVGTDDGDFEVPNTGKFIKFQKIQH